MEKIYGAMDYRSFCVFLVLLLFSVHSQSHAQADSIATYSGNGGQNTRPFAVDNNWEIQWDSKGDIFQLYLYSSEGELLGIPANQGGPGRGDSFQARGGTFYLQVNAIGDWEIEVIQIKNPIKEDSDSNTSGSNVIAEFSGKGGQNTRPFRTNDPWEIQWDFDGSLFQLFLHTSLGELVGVSANQMGPGKGSSFQPQKGEFYLQVNAVGNWEFKIVRVE